NGCISCLGNIDLHLALKLNAYGSAPSLLPNGDLLIIRVIVKKKILNIFLSYIIFFNIQAHQSF
ncbi:MAG: hypothetical protein ACTSPG_07520, partial [Candidatus Hodarchaeales archaeon]